MSEFEVATLFIEYLGTYHQVLIGYISLLFAFLVMSYFASGKLTKWISLISLALFTAVCFMLIMQMNLIRNDIEGLYSMLLELRSANNSGATTFGNNPPWAVKANTILVNLVSFGGYVGCITFFFVQRTNNE